MSLRVTDLAKRYGPVAVLNGVTFQLATGGRLAVVGPSGSGKSTLLRLVAGLDLPDAGEVALGDRVVSRPGQCLPPHQRGVGLAFQSAALWPHLTALENVRFGLRGLGREAARAAAAAWLARVDLAGLDGRYPDQLSGGQAQRVALARALAPAPPFLLLDEPLTHVEPALKQLLMAVIHDHLATTGATLLYVTHDVAEARAMTERQVVLDGGRIESPVPVP